MPWSAPISLSIAQPRSARWHELSASAWHRQESALPVDYGEPATIVRNPRLGATSAEVNVRMEDIIQLLAKRPLTGREIAQRMQLPAGVVLHYLGRLRDAGRLQMSRKARGGSEPAVWSRLDSSCNS